MTTYGISVLADVDPRLVLRSVDAEVRFGEEKLDGRLFLAHRRSEVAACVQVETWSGDRIEKLADEGRLAVAIDIEERAGLSIVAGAWLYNGTAPGASAWVGGRHHGLLPEIARTWAPHVMIASMGGKGLPAMLMPQATRPRGEGDALELRLVGEIDERCERLPEKIAAAGNRSINLIVDSSGGSVFTGKRIYDALIAHPREVTARILRAHSMAAAVSLAADVRMIAPDASMLLHAPHTTAEHAEAADLREHADYLDQVRHEITTLVALRCDLEFDIVDAWTKKETVFDVGTAVAVGLAHGIDLDVIPKKPAARRVTTRAIAAPFSSFRASPLRA